MGLHCLFSVATGLSIIKNNTTLQIAVLEIFCSKKFSSLHLSMDANNGSCSALNA
jgi:hypothetical protein